MDQVEEAQWLLLGYTLLSPDREKPLSVIDLFQEHETRLTQTTAKPTNKQQNNNPNSDFLFFQWWHS